MCPALPLSRIKRVVATLRAKRNSVISNKSDGNTEKSSGLVAPSVMSNSKMVSPRFSANSRSSSGGGSGTSKTTSTPNSATDSTISLRGANDRLESPESATAFAIIALAIVILLRFAEASRRDDASAQASLTSERNSTPCPANDTRKPTPRRRRDTAPPESPDRCAPPCTALAPPACVRPPERHAAAPSRRSCGRRGRPPWPPPSARPTPPLS